MPIDATGSATAAATAAPQAGATSSVLSGLGTDGFLQLLVAQLKYQSPMSPSDPTALLQQTGQLAQVEMMQKATEASNQLIGLQQTSLASGLIGKEVTAMADGDREVTGIVEAVRFSASGPMLVVDGTEVPVSHAQELRRATTTASASTKPDATAADAGAGVDLSA